MKTIIFCGGKGSRMKEETEFKPKPMVEIGGKPILWHIMKIYSHHGYRDFILPVGYKGSMIKEYFLNHRALSGDFTFHTASNALEFHGPGDDFRITFADTGQEALTGERLLKVAHLIDGDEFMVTYGDGVSDIDIGKLVAFHRSQGTMATVTAVHPTSKYGVMKHDPDTHHATHFKQKGIMEDTSINGGFMVFNRAVLNHITPGALEDVFSPLIQKKQLSLYAHNGFWKGMDTYREMEELNVLWETTKPWAVWA